MKPIAKVLSLMLIPILVVACSSGSDKGQPLTPTTTIAPTVTFLSTKKKDNQDLFKYLQSDYYWNNALPTSINNGVWDSMPEAMEDLRAPQDRFSFIMTRKEAENYKNSVFLGFGFSYQKTVNKDGLLLRYTLEGSSAFESGLKRGDIITHINDEAISDLISQGRLSGMMGPNEVGYKIDIRYKKPGGITGEAQVEKDARAVNTVMANKIIDTEIAGKPAKVGYLVIHTFKESSEQELESAFELFHEQQVDELILDLRYNTGGDIGIAKQLSTQIAGSHVENRVFAKFEHNENRRNWDKTEYFQSVSDYKQLHLNKLLVLTSGKTCSTSEMLINSLTPFIDVTVIGEQTCGKPIGMYPTELNGWTVYAINFQTFNAVNHGDYFDGLTPDCLVNGTIPGDWGTETEALLAEGLHYLQHENCSSSTNSLLRQYIPSKRIDFSQGPYKVNNEI